MEEVRIVFLDAGTVGDVSFESFRPEWQCVFHEFSSSAQVRNRLAGNRVAIVNKVALDTSILHDEAARELKLIAVAATGTDNVGLAAARERGIQVRNVPGYAGRSVAQFTMGLILELASSACAGINAVREGRWEKSRAFSLLDFPSMELAGKTLGIVGYGNIGRMVGEMASNFDMNVVVSARPRTLPPHPAGRRPFDEVLKSADFLTLHCPLTPESRGLIDERALALMKPSAFLINTARGALVDDRALVEALEQKRLGGAALDVLTKEPPPADHPLIVAAKRLNNLLVTPHCAWTAREARQRLIEEVAENIAAFIRGEDRNRVA
ncbi:MAG: D-2-hydroxyacid dehydrogenase [Candidatus Binatia bacterium]